MKVKIDEFITCSAISFFCSLIGEKKETILCVFKLELIQYLLLLMWVKMFTLKPWCLKQEILQFLGHKAAKIFYIVCVKNKT